MYAEHPHLAAIDQVTHQEPALPAAAKERLAALPDEPLAPLIEDCYQTNPITRASAVMAELSAVSQVNQLGATGTNG